jgi:aminoglycoside phosphotransferase (APT) family kinase protein
MTIPAMHQNEIVTTVAQVRSLVSDQFPEFADLPIDRVASSGTDNAMYRLGNDLAVRLPLIESAIDMVKKEQTWVPYLAPQLPLRLPRLVAEGTLSEDFPYPWSIVEWLPGELASLSQLTNPISGARTLADFVKKLQQIDPDHGPTHERGGPVRNSDQEVRQGIAALQNEVDPRALTRAWERVLEIPDYSGPPRWFHGDLKHLNLLAHKGRLTSVIDWGTCGVGDPAIDSRVAWNLFDRDAREAYRETVGFDDEAWERGKGWILTGVSGIVYYRHTNPTLVRTCVQGIQAVLDEP